MRKSSSKGTSLICVVVLTLLALPSFAKQSRALHRSPDWKATSTRLWREVVKPVLGILTLVPVGLGIGRAVNGDPAGTQMAMAGIGAATVLGSRSVKEAGVRAGLIGLLTLGASHLPAHSDLLWLRWAGPEGLRFAVPLAGGLTVAAYRRGTLTAMVRDLTQRLRPHLTRRSTRAE